ncbi:MAG: hypothetical protein AB7T48_05190 [Solirubrobacterales bacterium]
MNRAGAVRVALVALVAALLMPASAVAGRAIDAGLGCRTAFCASVSADGSRVVFPYHGELIAGAGTWQLYEWHDGKVRSLLAPGLSQGQFLQMEGASADATHVFVSTRAALSPEDTDGSALDVYDIQGGTPSLISTGPLDHPAEQTAAMPFFQGSSPDGSRVFFQDTRALTVEDLDICPSLYERAAGQTRMIAPNPEPPPFPICEWPDFGGLSRDGSHLFFVSGVDLQAGDDEGEDIYQQVGASLTRLATGPEPASNCTKRLRVFASSGNGDTILFSTNGPALPEDTNGTDDLYKRRPDGSFVLVSKGTPAAETCAPSQSVRGVALSADGGTTVFETVAALSPADKDAAPDLYSADDNGAFELLSSGPTDPQVEEPTTIFPDWLSAASEDARTVAFETQQRLVAADRDDSADVYLRAGGLTSLLLEGPPSRPAPTAELSGISADGNTVAFATRAGLVAGDTNRQRDYYLRRIGSKRPVLLSAETTAPAVWIARRAARLPAARVAIRLVCPKAEENGPCRGNLRLAQKRNAKPLGQRAFQIAVGKRKRIVVRLRRPLPPAKQSLVARARGIDSLGNARVSTRTVRFGRR